MLSSSEAEKVMSDKTAQKKAARVIAFYLPQFHPTPENDEWWGKGFTEWTNVASARALFKGHEQPVIPADLGFYDLRLPETRLAQAEMAASYGVEGFCYWHYWFGGRRMLERPFNEVLSSGQPDFPFCVGWANHSWSGIWKDEPHRKLIDQTYPGDEDDRAHFEYLLKAFSDERYITVDGKPLLVIFKPTDMPDPKRRFDLWRELALQAGLKGLHIVGINMLDFKSAKELGLDAVTLSTLAVTNTANPVVNALTKNLWRIRRKLSLGGPRIVEYSEAIKLLVPDLNQLDCEAYPCVYPNWDNTPRKGRKGLVLANSTPALFEKHVKEAVTALGDRADEHKLVFLLIAQLNLAGLQLGDHHALVFRKQPLNNAVRVQVPHPDMHLVPGLRGAGSSEALDHVRDAIQHQRNATPEFRG